MHIHLHRTVGLPRTRALDYTAMIYASERKYLDMRLVCR